METITQTTTTEYVDNFQKLDLSHLKRLNMSEEETLKENEKFRKQVQSGDLSRLRSGKDMKKLLDKYNHLFT
ncbi:MAG: hypothetical protein HRU03_06215 [Nanoarchaeales archaeon]|nr:hypothetical protein [Nanoarchaeales archaeon]